MEDSDQARNRIGLTTRDLNRIAHRLSDKWQDACIELGMDYNSVKQIELMYPKDIKRQALEGLVTWKNSLHGDIENATDDFIRVMEEMDRKDVIDIALNSRDQPLAIERNLESRQGLKRSAVTCSRQYTKIVNYAQIENISEVRSPGISHSRRCISNTIVERCVDEQVSISSDEEEAVNFVKQVVNDTIKVRVIKKSPVTAFGRKTTKNLISALLLTDSGKKIIASAFEDDIEYVNNKLNDGMVYHITGYRYADRYFKNVESIDLSKNTCIELVFGEETPPILETLYSIAKIKRHDLVQSCVSVGPVVVASVGRIRKPKLKYLREVLLKDKTGRIIMNIWNPEGKENFEYKTGNCLELYNIHVDYFNGYSKTDYNITMLDVSQVREVSNESMIGLLNDEDEYYLIPLDLNICQMKELNVCKHLVCIKGIQVETFAKKSSVIMVYKVCDNDDKHGKLTSSENGWHCKECCANTDGIDLVRLQAEIIDKSKNSVWVTFFNASAQVILGDKYESFLNGTHLKRKAILEKIERKNTQYSVEIQYNPDRRNQTVKKLELN